MIGILLQSPFEALVLNICVCSTDTCNTVEMHMCTRVSYVFSYHMFALTMYIKNIHMGLYKYVYNEMCMAIKL